MSSVSSGRLRSVSVSSMRSSISPPCCRATSQLNNTVRAPPTCSQPVGEGAKRRRGVAAAITDPGYPRGVTGKTPVGGSAPSGGLRTRGACRNVPVGGRRRRLDRVGRRFVGPQLGAQVVEQGVGGVQVDLVLQVVDLDGFGRRGRRDQGDRFLQRSPRL